MKRGISILLSALMVFGPLSGLPAAAEEDYTDDWVYAEVFSDPIYTAVSAGYTLPAYRGAGVTFPLSIRLELLETASFTIDAPEDALYEISLSYQNSSYLILPSEVTMQIDGEVRFIEMRRLSFESLWVDSGVIPEDRYGNQMSPKTFPADMILEKALSDSSGRTAVPLLFELTQGRHEVTFSLNDGSIEFFSVTLRAPETPPAYRGERAAGDALFVREAQDIASRSSSSIRAAGEYTASLTPQSTTKSVLNLLDDASFAAPGSRVDYLVEAPADGWYQLAFCYRQRAKNGFPVFYDLQIDGAPPSDAASLLTFPTATSFTTMTVPAPDGSAQTFYLTKGEHTLSVILNIQPMRAVFEEIDALFKEISDITSEIIRLTGGVTVDAYRDFKLEEYIPGLKERLLDWAGRCDAMYDSLLPYMNKGRSDTFATLHLCSKALRRLAEKPEDLPRRLGALSRGPSSVTRYLASMLEGMNNNAVGLDRIYLYQEDAVLPRQVSGFSAFWYSVKRFFASFFVRYYNAADADTENLQVWMARPRQYVELLQNMIDAQFTPRTGITVDLSIMPDQSKLALACAAGEAPDVALSTGYVLPSYLSIREALYDLKQFSDFKEVARRFPEGMFIPYISENGVYGLPETINFWVMFYRSDIFSALGIPIPHDMDEVKAILPELQRRSMNFFFPTAGMVGVKLFPGTMPLIVQSGGGFFGDTIGHTTLDSEASLRGFREMTELFTVYDMPIDVPAPGFYQQFRNGSLPIGVSDISTYNLLNTSAPELAGLWELAPFPGLRNADGEVLRYTTGGAEADIIFQSTARPDDAWEFLKWWSSDEVQTEYGVSLQSIYGKAYLWNTANKNAFEQLPIQASHKKVILEQADWMIEVPWVPGTYMVERELSNAYNSVVVDGMSVRRAMDVAVKRINREIDRKLEEFGFTAGGETVRDFPTPDTGVLWED